MSTRDALGWSANDWQSKVTYVKPSGGGAVGVVFVFTQAGAAAATPVSQAAFVVKPMQGSGATTKFAEHLLNKVAKVASPNSKPILKKSSEGTAFVSVINQFNLRETDASVRDRWGQVLRHYSAADHFLIQDLQVGIREFGDVYRTQNGLNTLLQNEKLMINIGKLFAADAFIGNGDRLFQPNMGNIVFKPNGTLCSIDSSTILTSFNSILNEVDQETRDTFGGAFGADRNEWGTNVIGKVGGLAVPSAAQQAGLAEGHAPVLPPSFGMGVLFDVDDWWNHTFKPHLEAGLNALNPPQASPKSLVWAAAKMAFKSGVDDGLKQVDSKLSG
jgi:hypothetical protein